MSEQTGMFALTKYQNISTAGAFAVQFLGIDFCSRINHPAANVVSSPALLLRQMNWDGTMRGL